MDKITKLGNLVSTLQGGKMIVNTEWGAFDNQVTIFSLHHFGVVRFDRPGHRHFIAPHIANHSVRQQT